MNPLALFRRCALAVARFFELIDPANTDYGNDDEATWVRVESAQQVRPHVELNGCGCGDCQAALQVIRRALLAEADLADIRAIAALPLAAGAEQ